MMKLTKIVLKLEMAHIHVLEQQFYTKRDDAEGNHCPNCTKPSDGGEVLEELLLFHSESATELYI